MERNTQLDNSPLKQPLLQAFGIISKQLFVVTKHQHNLNYLDNDCIL